VIGLQQFVENIFLVDGPVVQAVGIPFPTRMVIVKLTDGSLWVNSPVTVPADTMDRIKTLGSIRYLVAPTKLHVWRLESWHALFPNAELWGPPRIPRTFKRLPFTGVLEDTVPSRWSEDFDQLVFRGNWFVEEVYFLHKPSGAVIFGDFIQNHRLTKGHPFQNMLWKLAGVAYPNGGVPPDIRLSFTNRRLARRSLQRLLSWDFDKLILAHGVCVEREAKQFVKRAFSWLAR
jgi:Domain of unknown function (DUF4336)